MIHKKNKIVSSKVSEVLSKLMADENIKEAELARRTNLPATTINRLLLGETNDPRANTLKPLAQYFNVSIEQLLGEIPIRHTPFNKKDWKNVPIIEWNEAISWIFKKNSISPDTHNNWVITEKNVGEKCFAIKSTPSMEPRFRNESILIVDPDEKIQDGKYVVLTLDKVNVSIKKIKIDGAIIYLEGFDKRLPIEIYDSKKNKLLGIIVESRVNL